MSTPPAKFFVNQGVVNSRTDILHLLRPLLKQTVTYRYLRGRDTVAHGTGWVERIVVDSDDVSTYFTPLAITLNIDSFEHLEFETRPDQLLVYTLVQGDERVVVEFAPVGPGTDDDIAVRTAPARVRHQRLRPDGAARPRRPRRRIADSRRSLRRRAVRGRTGSRARPVHRGACGAPRASRSPGRRSRAGTAASPGRRSRSGRPGRGS